MELDIWVVDISFIIESWIDDLKLGNILISIIISEWFGYINDDTER